MTIFNKTSLL